MKSILSNITSKKVSYQENTWASLSKEITILESLNLIKSDIFKYRIEKLREHLKQGKKAEYDKHKVTLPAVTFCASFDGKRKRDNIKSYNSIIVIDIESLLLIQLNFILGKVVPTFSTTKS